MKKKMLRNGIVFAVILALLGAGFWILQSTKPQEEEEEGSIPLYTGEKAAVEEITIQNTLGAFTLKKEADGTFSFKDDPGIPVYQTKAGNLAYTVSSVYAQSVVEKKPQNFVQYGLSNPAATVTVALSGGETKVYYLGNDLPIGNESYFMMEGDPAVYTVSTVSWGDVKLEKNAYYDMTLPEFPESDAITQITVAREGGALAFQKSELEEGYSADWQMTSPAQRAADNNAVENDILATLRSLRAVNVFGANETPEDMGLGRITVTVHTNDGEILYRFGKNTNEGTYMTVSGSDLCYLVSTGALEPFTDEAFRYMSKTLLSPHIDSVDSVSVTVEGETHVLSVGEQYALDDQEISEEKARSMYSSIIGLTAGGVKQKAAEAPNGENEITFTLKDGTAQTLSFGEIDGRNLAVYQNGESNFTIAKKDLTDLWSKLK